MTPEQKALYAKWDELCMKALDLGGTKEDMDAFRVIDKQCRDAQVPGFPAV